MTTTHPTHCIRCGEPLRIQEQHWTHKPEPTIMLDCTNARCDLAYVTAGAESYAETVAAFLAAPTRREAAIIKS